MNAAIQTLSAFATFSTKAPATSTSAKVDPKIQFAKYATQAKTALLSGVTKHKWFTVNEDKTVGVQLIRGIKPLVLSGQNLMICSNVATASLLLDQAMQLVAAGLLDAELEAAKPIIDPTKPRKPRAKKVVAEVVAA